MSQKDEIKVARTAGFCWGVKRAMDMTLETAKDADGPVYTHGPLIHNPQVIEMLEGKEVYAVDDASALEEGRVIIRTHGVTPEVRRGLKGRGFSISDATCPLVARVQGIIKKYASRGYDTVIIGDKGHAEVVGLMGYANGRGHVIGSVEEARSLPEMDKVCVVAQTTCDTTRYDKIVDTIKARYPNAVTPHTICDATEQRQGEVLDIATQVDAMVVVGGKNSANTNRLAKIASEADAVTFLVETEDELDAEELSRYERIGLTAGASTPSWMIQRVYERIKSIKQERSTSPWARLRRALEIAVVSNISVALGAGLMVFVNATLAGIKFSWAAAYIAGAYLFSMHVLNRLNDVKTFKHNEPETIRFYLKHRELMTGMALAAAVTALAAAFSAGPGVTMVVLWALALGLGYTVKWFPKSTTLRIHRLKDIPASKDVFVGLAWAVITAVIPALAVGAALLSPSVVMAFAYTFILVYIRSVLSDIRDIHGDRLVGRETIPILIGVGATKVFLAALSAGLAALLIAASYIGWVGPFGYVLLFSIAYTAFYLYLYHRRVISGGFPFNLTMDGVFHFSGLLAIIWMFLH